MQTSLNTAPYDLGLDIGIASVGAALVADDHIVALHVRTFDKAEMPKKGESPNTKRREARLTRRRLRRRRSRLSRLRKLFNEWGLPASLDNEGHSPWRLRAEALERRMSPSEWAIVLYHLLKHRGFQSNRKADASESEESGLMLKSAHGNQHMIHEKGYRTVGEMIARDPIFSKKKRNTTGDYSHTLLRDDIEEELQALFKCQRNLGNEFTGNEFEEKIFSLLMERKSALSGEDLLKMVGSCTFEPSELRAPKSLPSSERFVWLSKLVNLRIRSLRGERTLSAEERKSLDRKLQEKGSLKYSEIRKCLGLEKDDSFVGIRYSSSIFKEKGEDERRKSKEKDPEDKVFYENKHLNKLKKKYLDANLERLWLRDLSDPERLDLIAQALTVFKTEEDIRKSLTSQGVEREIIEAVLSISFSGFLNLSRKAILKILPYLEEGFRYDEAVVKAGYSHHSVIKDGAEGRRFLPPVESEEIRNPVVFRALNQARKMVNAIVRRYGSPRSIHIELARDLNKSFEERRDIKKDQENSLESKEELYLEFKKLFSREPKKDELQKLRLYREQDGKCPYCQEEIDLRRLPEDKYTEVDHALPYSRSYDDSLSNRVLVHIKENQDKGNATPFEYLGGESSERWRRYRTFVEGNAKYGRAKRSKLLREHLDENETQAFLERNLSDTRFIARYFKNLVESSLRLDGEEKKRCVVVSGQMTAYLRRHWGLTKKREESDLHHAMDAAVVAVTSHSMVKRLSDWSGKRERRYQARSADSVKSPEFPKPYPRFIEELNARMGNDPQSTLKNLSDFPQHLIETAFPIRVSRAPKRLGTGQAHKETIRSIKYQDQKKTWKKILLTELKAIDIENIVAKDDPRNRALVEGLRQRLVEHGDNAKKAFAEPFYKPSREGKGPRIISVKVFHDLKSGVLVRGGIAERGRGSMIRIDIFTDEKKFYVVPLYIENAGKKELPNRAVGSSNKEGIEMTDNFRFLFSLYPNDWIRVEQKDKVIEGYYVNFDISTGAITIESHDRNKNIGKDGVFRSIGIKVARSLTKFHVDFLGGLHRVLKEVRQSLRKED